MGRVRDVRMVEASPVSPVSGQPSLEVAALIVGRAGIAERLGYAYGEVRGPWLIRVVMQRLARRGRVVPWDRIARLEEDCVIVAGEATDLPHPAEHRGARQP